MFKKNIKKYKDVYRIGIIGPKGEDRQLIAWLLGGILENFIKHPGEDCLSVYKEMIEEYKKYGEEAIGSSNTIVLESFGRYILDHMKLFVGSCYNLELNHYSDLISYIIDLDTFDVHAKKMDEHTYEGTNKITLKDFIIRFGECLKKEFGDDAWVKSTDSWVVQRDDEASVVIYTDVKTDCEINHIINNQGFLIEVGGEPTGSYNKITHEYKARFICPPGNIFSELEAEKPVYYYKLLQLAAECYSHFSKDSNETDETNVADEANMTNIETEQN